MAYTPNSSLSSLSQSPTLLREMINQCVHETSIENLEAFVFLQYIESRVQDGQATHYEALFFINEFTRVGSASEINVASAVLRLISPATLIAPVSEARQKLFHGLTLNLSDTLQRMGATATQVLQKIQDEALGIEGKVKGKGYTSIGTADLLAVFNEIRAVAVGGGARKPYRSPFNHDRPSPPRPRNFLQRLFKR